MCYRLVAAKGNDLSGHLSHETLAPVRSVHRSFEGPGQIRSWQSPIGPIRRSRRRDTLQVTGSSYAIDMSQIVPGQNNRPEQKRVVSYGEPTRHSQLRRDMLSLSPKVHGIPE